MIKRLVIAICGMILVTGVLAAGQQALFKAQLLNVQKPASASQPLTPKATAQQASSALAPQNSSATQPQANDIPVHVMYGLLFHEMAAFKKKADEQEQKGQDASALRAYHRDKANLNPQQSELLDQVAADCERAVAALDEAAKKIIDAERARHPQGRLRPGETVPPVPKELLALEQKRTNTILQARARIESAFGATEFQRFEEFLRRDAAERIKPVTSIMHPVKVPHRVGQQ